MNWDAVGAIGEVVGALGVVATLGYLAVQIRQNTASVRSSTAAATNAQLSDLFSILAKDPTLAALYGAGLQDPKSLSEPDRVRFNFLMHKVFVVFEDSFHQHREGHLTPELWHRIDAVLPWYARHPGFAAWWKSEKFIYSPSFREFVEAVRSQTTTAAVWWEQTPDPTA